MIKNKVVRTKANNCRDGGYSELEQAFNDGWVFKNVVILNGGSEAEYILEKDVDEEEQEDGVWVPNEFGFGFVCSKCNSSVNSKHNKYCHNCGRYMKNNSYNKYYVEDGLNKEADY
jgi:hypothetical protein